MGSRQKNQMLYLWEGIACLSVILIHCRFPGVVGIITETQARFAVPLFFAISGFFWNSNIQNTEKRVREKIKKMLSLFIVALVIYTAYKLLVKEITLSIFSVSNLFKLIIFNYADFICGTLWFLLALVYCYIFIWIIDKFNKYNILPTLAAVLLILNYIGRIFFYKKGFLFTQIFLYRNWLMTAIPFFIIGYIISLKKDIIVKKINGYMSFFIIVIGMICSLVERYFLNIELDFYIGSLIIICGIFALSLKKTEVKYFKILQYLGENCTLFIYLFHPLIMYVIRRVFHIWGLGDSGISAWLLPISVAICAIVMAVLFNVLKNKVKKA